MATFAAAVGGAFVGGHTANEGARRLADDEARRAQARELAAARASARVLVGEMRSFREHVGMSGSRLCWLRLDYELELTHEDRVRLASQLGAQEWLDVMRAFRHQDRVSIERRDGFSWRPGQPSPDMTLVVNVLDSFDDWIGRLARFAHARNPDRLDPAPVIQAYADTKRAPAGTQPGCR